MKRLFFLIILAIMLIGLFVSRLGHTVISVEDTAIPNNEVASTVSKTSNSSSSATITITMTGVLDE